LTGARWSPGRSTWARTNRELFCVAPLGDAIHPAVLTLIARTAAAAGCWTAVCGELAADPLAVPLLVGLGVRQLSVSAPSVGAVQEAVRATDLAAARELATLAARLASAEAVRGLVRHGFRGVRAGRRWT
jgi:multiphosphoryl transfer protein